MCKASVPVVPLEVVAYTPYRPIGKSHYVPMPQVDDYNISDDAYRPSAMTHLALSKSVNKALDPLKSYSDAQCDKIFLYLRQRFSSIWYGDNFTCYEDAVALLNFDKSAGWPYYYDCVDKLAALDKHGDLIQSNVGRVVAGEEVPMPFSLTLKDELRTKERVAEEKTRGFSASGMEHLIASKMMFEKQNDKLVDTFGCHPVTLGISVPGPQFVRAVLSLGKKQNCYDADGDGCDQRFNLCMARVIRELRKAFLSQDYHACVDLLYDTVYAGDAVCCGVIHRLLHNKSGWQNTGHDNSIYMWGALFDSVGSLTRCEFDQVCELLVNGDDLALSINYEEVSIKDVADYLADYNVLISFDVVAPRFSTEITFLSHTVRQRFVPGFGDVLIAAGNLPKLLSSLHWVKPTSSLTFEESCLAHLLGLRICLWPWRIEFLEVEETIDKFLVSHHLSSVMSLLLRGRLSEVELLNLHLRMESRVSFLPTVAQVDYIEVGQVTTCLIKDLLEKSALCKNNNQNLRKLSAKRRAIETKC